MPIGEYCDAAFTPGGLSGHQAILLAHFVYVAAAGYWLGRSTRAADDHARADDDHARADRTASDDRSASDDRTAADHGAEAAAQRPRPSTRPAWTLPLATLLYAVGSMLWHLTGRRGFAAADGALSLVFLVLVAEWCTREQVPLVRWLRAAAPAIAYVPLYQRLGAPAYLAAMAAGGLWVYWNLRQLDDVRAWRSAWLALAAIGLAFACWLLDQPLCGLTGFLTGHALAHVLDGCCFFLLMRAMVERAPA